MTTLHLSHRKNGKCGPQKYVKVVSKLNFKKKSLNENFISEIIETFLIHIYFNLKKF